MPLTSSMEDYLEAVLIVAKKQIEVRSVDIARQLNVSKPSVWRAMTVLKDGGFLTDDWPVCRAAAGRNPCTAMGFGISGYRCAVFDGPAGVAHGT